LGLLSGATHAGNRLCYPGAKYGRQVLGALKPTCCDCANEQALDIEMVGLGSPEFHRQRAECLGLDNARSLARREPAAAHQFSPSVVLRSRRDGLVLCRELCNGTPRILLRHDRFVCGLFGADVLQNAAKDAASRRIVVVPRSRPDMATSGRSTPTKAVFASRPLVIAT
jgi:hypothetical protein